MPSDRQLLERIQNGDAASFDALEAAKLAWRPLSEAEWASPWTVTCTTPPPAPTASLAASSGWSALSLKTRFVPTRSTRSLCALTLTTKSGSARGALRPERKSSGVQGADDRMNKKLIEEKLHDSDSSEVYVYELIFNSPT